MSPETGLKRSLACRGGRRRGNYLSTPRDLDKISAARRAVETVFKKTIRRATDERSPLRLAAFLLASLGLHAGLLLLSDLAPYAPGHTDAVLYVSLEYAAPAPPRAMASVRTTRASPPDMNRRKVRPEPAAATLAEQPSSTTGAGTGTGVGADLRTEARPLPPAVAPSTSTAPPQEEALARVQALLLADLRRYFDYPAIARRRGWEGVVRLSVTVQSDGALERVHVTRTSGYDLLDLSALAAVRRVERLAQAPPWLQGGTLELPLAVVYRLTD